MHSGNIETKKKNTKDLYLVYTLQKCYIQDYTLKAWVYYFLSPFRTLSKGREIFHRFCKIQAQVINLKHKRIINKQTSVIQSEASNVTTLLLALPGSHKQNLDNFLSKRMKMIVCEYCILSLIVEAILYTFIGQSILLISWLNPIRSRICDAWFLTLSVDWTLIGRLSFNDV